MIDSTCLYTLENPLYLSIFKYEISVLGNKYSRALCQDC